MFNHLKVWIAVARHNLKWLKNNLKMKNCTDFTCTTGSATLLYLFSGIFYELLKRLQSSWYWFVKNPYWHNTCTSVCNYLSLPGYSIIIIMFHSSYQMYIECLNKKQILVIKLFISDDIVLVSYFSKETPRPISGGFFILLIEGWKYLSEWEQPVFSICDFIKFV